MECGRPSERNTASHFLLLSRVMAQLVRIQDDADAGSGRQMNMEVLEAERLGHEVPGQDLRAEMLAAPFQLTQCEDTCRCAAAPMELSSRQPPYRPMPAASATAATRFTPSSPPCFTSLSDTASAAAARAPRPACHGRRTRTHRPAAAACRAGRAAAPWPDVPGRHAAARPARRRSRPVAADTARAVVSSHA